MLLTRTIANNTGRCYLPIAISTVCLKTRTVAVTSVCYKLALRLKPQDGIYAKVTVTTGFCKLELRLLLRLPVEVYTAGSC